MPSPAPIVNRAANFREPRNWGQICSSAASAGDEDQAGDQGRRPRSAQTSRSPGRSSETNADRASCDPHYGNQKERNAADAVGINPGEPEIRRQAAHEVSGFRVKSRIGGISAKAESQSTTFRMLRYVRVFMVGLPLSYLVLVDRAGYGNPNSRPAWARASWSRARWPRNWRTGVPGRSF